MSAAGGHFGEPHQSRRTHSDRSGVRRKQNLPLCAGSSRGCRHCRRAERAAHHLSGDDPLSIYVCLDRCRKVPVKVPTHPAVRNDSPGDANTSRNARGGVSTAIGAGECVRAAHAPNDGAENDDLVDFSSLQFGGKVELSLLSTTESRQSNRFGEFVGPAVRPDDNLADFDRQRIDVPFANFIIIATSVF